MATKSCSYIRTGARTAGVFFLIFLVSFAGLSAFAGKALAAEEETTYYELRILVCPYIWMGATSPPDGTYSYIDGTTAIITAVETDEAFSFLYWSVGHPDDPYSFVTLKKATIKILMDEDHLACAYFGYKGGDGGPTKP